VIIPIINSPKLNIRINRERLSEQVVNQLQTAVIRGELSPGDRLPPERELAESLGVSRTVIREAVKTLENRGLVRVLVGSGTFVARVSPKVVSTSVSLFLQQGPSTFENLYEVRAALEVEIAGFAAQRATAADLEAIEAVIGRFEAIVRDMTAGGQPVDERRAELAEADMAFHIALGKAAGNPLFHILLEPVSDLLLEWFRVAIAMDGSVDGAVRDHRRLLDLVRAGDVAGARRVAREHLDEGLRKWHAIAARLGQAAQGQRSAAREAGR
jgi:GntR family transcriptional repressor for pyruvate dehydrogenase complex